jgi:hypothetical protein
VSSDPATLAEIILGAGLLNIFLETGKWLRNRKRNQVDVTGRAQEIAFELMEKLHGSLEEAQRDASAAKLEASEARQAVAQARLQLDELHTALDEVIAWARMAKRELDAHGVEIAPIPVHRFGTNGVAG